MADPTPYDADSPIVKDLLRDVPANLRTDAAKAIPELLNACRTNGVTDPNQIAYVIATAQTESNFGHKDAKHDDMVERGNGKSADGIDHYFDRYGPDTAKGKELGNVLEGDGEKFRGRGFVQVTGRGNYADWSKKLGLPDEIVAGKPVPYLVAHPEKLTEPKIAAEVMVRGMKQPHGFCYNGNLDTYINGQRTDFYDARQIVNGHDRASIIEGNAKAYAQTLGKDAAQIDPRLTPLNAHIHDLNTQGAKIIHATTLKPWDGKAHGGTVVQLDDTTYAMHVGRGIYQTLDLQRDLHGVAPPDGRFADLDKTGHVHAREHVPAHTR